MFNSYDDFWSSLLFKIVSVPFVVLLVAIAAHQTISLQHSAAVEQSKSGSPDVGDTSF